MQAKSYPGADCGSDHNPVVCTIRVKLRRLKPTTSGVKRQWNLLREDQELKDRYAISVQNRFEVLECRNSSKWEVLKEALVETGKEVIQVKEKERKKDWMKPEILELMKIRQRVRNKDSSHYKTLSIEIRNGCRKAKQEWIDQQCNEIERTKISNPTSMYKNIRRLTGKKICHTSGCIKAKDGSIMVEIEEQKERWREYIEELFMDERGDKPAIEKVIEGPKVMQSEVKAAIKKLKMDKAPGPDQICIEMIKALDEFGIAKVTDLINEIYDTGEIHPDLCKSIFVTLPKKPGATECELHRTISLMSHITKILMRVIMARTRKAIRPEIGKEQFGFVQNAGTRNAIFILRMLLETAIERQRNLYVCFIDYSKAFDKVRHENLIEILQSLDIDGKDVRILRNLYWEQTAGVRVQNEVGEYCAIRRGVRQGCVFSPDLFNLYTEQIMRAIGKQGGFLIGGYNMNNIRYADDTSLIAETEGNLQELLDIVVEESERRGLKINHKKTHCMAIGKNSQQIQCNIKIDSKVVQQVGNFYLPGQYGDFGWKMHIGNKKTNRHSKRNISTDVQNTEKSNTPPRHSS